LWSFKENFLNCLHEDIVNTNLDFLRKQNMNNDSNNKKETKFENVMDMLYQMNVDRYNRDGVWSSHWVFTRGDGIFEVIPDPLPLKPEDDFALRAEN
jgi:hypothetical protein